MKPGTSHCLLSAHVVAPLRRFAALVTMAHAGDIVQVPFEDELFCCMDMDTPESPREQADILKKTFDDDELQNMLEQEIGLMSVSLDELHRNGLTKDHVQSH